MPRLLLLSCVFFILILVVCSLELCLCPYFLYLLGFVPPRLHHAPTTTTAVVEKHVSGSWLELPCSSVSSVLICWFSVLFLIALLSVLSFLSFLSFSISLLGTFYFVFAVVVFLCWFSRCVFLRSVFFFCVTGGPGVLALGHCCHFPISGHSTFLCMLFLMVLVALDSALPPFHRLL